MSSRPSAFDALMSGARAAAAKKKSQSQPQSSSPKKRKTLDSNSNLNPNPLKTIDSNITSSLSSEPANDTESVDVKDSVEAQEPATQELGNGGSAGSEVVPAAKKVRLVGSQEKIAELKKNVPLLKKKPGSFDPSLVACWEKGEPVPFLFLSLALDMIADETGRIVITDIVCNMLRTVIHTTPDDLVPVVYLSANRIAPAHEGLELGIGDASIIKALAEACGRTEAQIKNQYKVIIMGLFLF